MDWSIIKEKNKDYFLENPVSEIIISELFEQKCLKRDRSYLNEMARFVYFVGRGAVNNFKRSTENIEKYDGVIVTYLDRANDWGIMYPLIDLFDKMGYRILFCVSNKCYDNHQKELQLLRNSTVILNESMYEHSNIKFKIKHIKRIKKSLKKDIQIVKEYRLGNLFQYLKIYTRMLMQADSVAEKYLKEDSFSITLGERLWGIIYQIYGNRHYLIQHGHMTIGSIKKWSNYTSANNFYSVVFGEYYKTEFMKIYNQTNFIALGNPYYDSVIDRNIVQKRKIVFFSSSHPFIGENKIYNNKEYVVLDTIDEIIKLYDKIKEKYDFAVKLHPNESSEVFVKSNKLFGKEIEIIDGSVDSFEVLKETKILISWGSTVNLEAIIDGTLSVQLLKDKDLFREQEYNLVIKSLAEIEDVINNEEMIMQNLRYQRNIIDQYISNLGSSARSIVNFIESEELSCQNQFKKS